MSTQTDVSLCNLSLLSVGGRALLTSLNPSSNDKESQACAQLYPFVFGQLARTAGWNWCRKQAVLTLYQAALGTPENPTGTSYPYPPTPWLYSYYLPSDSLMVRYLVPSAPVNVSGAAPISPNFVAARMTFPGMGQIPYAVAYETDAFGNPIEVILTNLSQAQLVYTVNQPNPATWDSLFTSAFVASLAAYLVPALSMNAALMQINIANAEKIIATARRQDGNESFNSQDNTPDWIRSRGRWWDGASNYGNGAFGGWSNMNWPG